MTDANPLLTLDDNNADEAYDRVLPEAMALDAEDLIVININVMGAILTTMGVAKRLPSFEAELYALKQFPAAILPKFADNILALYSAQTRYVFATTPPEQLPELLVKATSWRDILQAEVRSLSARGLINGDLLKELTGTHGNKNVAMDLAGLARIFKSAWSVIEPHTGLKYDHIVEADKLALKMTAAVAQREQSPEKVAEATNIRLRMFTLLSNAYDEIRRAIQFLRWHDDDADTIAPSLYNGRVASRKKGGTETEQKSEPVAAPPAAVVTPAVAVTTRPATVAVGLPGADPFAG